MKEDLLLRPFQELVRASLPNLDLLGEYGANVLGQNADGSLELRADDLLLPPLSDVPIRHANNGMQVKVSAGSRVLVAFIAGDRRQPIVTHWEPHGLDEMKVTASSKVHLNAPNVHIGTNATHPIMRGDTYRTADSAFDSAFGTAALAYAAASVTPMETLGALSTNPTPTLADIKILASATAALFTAITAYMSALTSAAQAKESACATVLSNVSKTE